LHMLNGAPEYLGVAEDHTTRVFIAKFVADHQGSWHGYPADYRRKVQDVPPLPVRKLWLDNQVLTGPKIRKIGKQQRCIL
jgi:hypothetical protein